MKYSFKIINNDSYTRTAAIAALALSLVCGFIVIGILFLAKGINPFYAVWKIFSGSFGSSYGIKETVTKSIPLIMTAAGLTVVFRGKFWNIGSEGQLLLGAAAATWVALKIGQSLPSPLVIFCMIIFAAIFGALWAIVPAFLRARLSINEVISTLMFNYIAAELVSFLVIGPWKGTTKYGYPYTDDIPASVMLGHLPDSRIHYFTLILAVILSIIIFYMLFRTKFGYEIRVTGENREAAKYAGINFLKTTLLMAAISGAMAGLAGFGEIAGIHLHLTSPEIISSGYGFTAIIVAWLGKLNPLLTIISGFFFAGILVGGDAIKLSLGLPAATVQVFNGTILVFLIIGDFFLKHRVTLIKIRQ
ncbi:MAG: ABC transporter permease [Spirochaetes bacterium]|nr:ABC transporter permease [Spirochaetota bacterium]